MIFSLRGLVFGIAVAVAAAANAQQATIAFGGLKQDTTLPVEVQADQLAVNFVGRGDHR